MGAHRIEVTPTCTPSWAASFLLRPERNQAEEIMATKKAEKKSNGEPKKGLSAKDRKALEKKRDQLYSVRDANEDLPYDMVDTVNSLSDKKDLKSLKTVLKTVGVDGTKFLAAIDKLQAEWKALNVKMDKASKAAEKEIDKLDKQLGKDEPDKPSLNPTFSF